MEVIKDKYYEWNKFYEWALENSDPRVKDWFLMQSYTPTLVITVLYVMLVYGGKWWMTNREPYKLKWAVFFYNVGLVILNFYIFSQVVIHTYRAGYSYICQPVNYTNDENEVNIAKALWWFYFSKCIEMMDTFFFVLKKKNNQISFLHVYHHATMFPLWWIGIKWVAGGQSFFGAMVNSLIHVIMYTYYGISALGPQYQKYLWWKRYLTMLQLTQFYIGMVYAFSSLYLDCDFPKWMQYFGLFYGGTIITLFLNFYIQEYIKKHNEKYKKKTDAAVANGAANQNGKHANGHVESKKTK
ncbi:elongation of very long chain fatty acids protein 4-like isoform X1 [Saccostrea echinata]|uniref:elongation of very long chain fatty acids protein 4-like isoform X1 n=1 Tax=Saccostrea echinata TaxID=191078 RepID=UPI002A7F417B|nr:elongation of very long chain fatty acids protein 4-like isoform X1 [Saccostrea echinata]